MKIWMALRNVFLSDDNDKPILKRATIMLFVSRQIRFFIILND